MTINNHKSFCLKQLQSSLLVLNGRKSPQRKLRGEGQREVYSYLRRTLQLDRLASRFFVHLSGSQIVCVLWFLISKRERPFNTASWGPQHNFRDRCQMQGVCQQRIGTHCRQSEVQQCWGISVKSCSLYLPCGKLLLP